MASKIFSSIKSAFVTEIPDETTSVKQEVPVTPQPDTTSVFVNIPKVAQAPKTIEGQVDDVLLQKIDAALHAPVFPLFLGRRSCPPEGRISLGIRPISLRDALKKEPWLVERKGNFTQILMDADENDVESYIQRDTPLSFDQTHRKFAFRRIVEISQNFAHLHTSNSDPETSHDPFEDLKDTED